MINEISVNIRDIQHYLYCPHRFGLMKIDCCWAENYFVVKANIQHEHVHSQDEKNIAGKSVYTAVTVWNDEPEYMLFGVTDCIERLKNGKYRIVEYKPTAPKSDEYREEDVLQLFAQKICVDYVFGCDSEGELYYCDTKRRVQLPLKEKYVYYDNILKCTLTNIRNDIKIGKIPPIRKDQNCSGCSMKDICMPKKVKPQTIINNIQKAIKDEEL